MTDIRIPKTIHYCWFGGKPLPDFAQKCIASWKKFCPDYEIKEWNEQNYDVRKIPYTAQAYAVKKYAFVSDYARFDILYEYGGIYFDTDVELIKPLDEIINRGAFCGIEQPGYIASGLGMAAPEAMPIFREILDSYKSENFINVDGSYNLTTVVTRVSDIFKKHGFSDKEEIQEVAGIKIYPPEYFCPKNILTGELSITNNTYSIHHFDASWVDAGIILIRKDKLDSWGIKMTPQEERIYYDALQHKFSITNKIELLTATNLMNRIFIAGSRHYAHNNLQRLLKPFIGQIAKQGLKNKATSIKLYFTTFRKWKIFETPRANARYIYHCFRNFLNV